MYTNLIFNAFRQLRQVKFFGGGYEMWRLIFFLHSIVVIKKSWRSNKICGRQANVCLFVSIGLFPWVIRHSLEVWQSPWCFLKENFMNQQLCFMITHLGVGLSSTKRKFGRSSHFYSQNFPKEVLLYTCITLQHWEIVPVFLCHLCYNSPSSWIQELATAQFDSPH